MLMDHGRARVLSLFLAQAGERLGPRRIEELAGAELDARAVERLLRSKGRAVRRIELGVGALASLGLPALVELNSGALAIVEQLRDQQVVLRDASDRARQLSLAELGTQLASAYEPMPVFRAQGEFGASLWGTLVQRGSELARLGVTILALVGLGLLAPWLTRQAISGTLDARSPSLLWSVVAALVAAAALRAWVEWLKERSRLAIESRLVRSAVLSTFQRMLSLPFGLAESRGFAKQLAALAAAESAARIVGMLVTAPVLQVVSFIAYAIALLVHSIAIGATLLVGSLLVLGVAYLLARWRSESEARVIQGASEARARLHELIQGIATVKAEHAERTMLRRWFDALLRERGAYLAGGMRQSWFSLWTQATERILRLYVMAYCALSVLDGKLALADFIYLGMLAEGLLSSLEASCHLLETATTLRAHTARVNTLFDALPRSTTSAGDRTGSLDGQPAVHMSDVWFRHGPDQPWILQGYDLKLDKGELRVLRGPSGQGKSTILRLLAGLYRPERGTVSVHGLDPARDHGAVRYLPQQAQLFAGSLRENLELLSGRPLEDVIAAAERTGLVRWLGTLPMGIETVIASGGANLSGGQRQWVLLTAAVASAQPVVLLDEPTSQIDHLVRGQLRLAELFAGKTTICVAHD
jgi:ATP-binding cassette, subfamily B, bacterial